MTTYEAWGPENEPPKYREAREFQNTEFIRRAREAQAAGDGAAFEKVTEQIQAEAVRRESVPPAELLTNLRVEDSLERAKRLAGAMSDGVASEFLVRAFFTEDLFGGKN